MTDVAVPPPLHRRGRLIALCLVVVIAGVNLAIFSGGKQSRPKPPSPNGYDDLDRAGSMIRGDWPNKGDWAQAKPDEVKAFVESNRASLDLARVGLGRECVVPIQDSNEGLNEHFESLGRVRQVARLLVGEGIVHEAAGRPVEAARSYRDVLLLGQAMSQGGLGSDVTAGWAVQGQTIPRLRKLRDGLPSREVVALLRDLESLDRRRVSFDAIEARRVLWYRGTYNPFQRTMLRWSGMEKQGLATETNVLKQAVGRVERPLRFLMIELAIHAYHEDKKAWPRSVNDLVPAYLASAPVDPSTRRPIDYPANPSGELTDDLSAIGRPDGEVAPRP